MGINSIEITGEITAYIICMFCFAACCVIKPLEAMSIYSTSSFIFVVGLVIYINDVKVLNSNIVNLLITMLLVGITSIMNYKSFSKDFLNKKHILQNKEELELTNQKLKEYENLRTDFFANISHELRTPLNVIYSAEQMLSILLQQKDFDSAKMNKYNKMIKQNTYRLLRLINNLIDITKIDASSFVVKLINIDIVKIVEDITMSVADYIEYKGISLIFDTEAEEKIVACDPDSIERIILNLLSNAVKFSPKNSSIFVSIFIETQNICISIKDTGIGISEEMQELIFDRFIQVDKLLKRAREGSGIGLALVKSLVEMHKGTISVKSKLNEGTEFIIRIPDKVISEDKDTSESYQIEEKCTNRVLIEFSDIYK
jgi:signal transduction histidine kinase